MNCTDQAKLASGLLEHRVTPHRVESVIDAEHYWHVPGTFMTVCALVCKNGFTVLGASACATAEEFDADIGKQVARDNAKREIQALECYALRNDVLRAL